MPGLLIAVFAGVFLVAALLLSARGTGTAERVKQTRERLDAALAVEAVETEDELVNVRKEEMLSGIPLLNRILLRLQVGPRLSRLLYQADIAWTTGGLLLRAACTFFIVSSLAYWRMGVAALAMLVGLALASWPLLYVLLKRSRRFEKFEEGLPAALDLIVSALRSGQSLASAMDVVAREIAGPIGKEFRICCDEQNYGLELRTAMENLAIRIPRQDVRVIITAIIIQRESGGNLAEVLDKCSHVIRERFRLRREIRTRTAQGRLTGWVLTLLPLVLGALLFMVNPENTSLLWTRPVGVKLLYASSVMTFIGGMVIRKIIKIKV
jgi:tight adherence protein B